MVAYTVVDLFSGGGGMSYGFHAHPAFDVVGAVDAQRGKPSSPAGALACNSTYAANMGIEPVDIDLGVVEPAELAAALGVSAGVDVLAACPPCTGFSRTNSRNHLVDDTRNALVPRVADYAAQLRPAVIVMENARELLIGNFRRHYRMLHRRLTDLGYTVRADVRVLTRYGLPQIRERALVVAVRDGLVPRTLDQLWDGYGVEPAAVTVRRAIAGLPSLRAGCADPLDPEHVSPAFGSARNLGRIAAIPHDGGSWRTLISDAEHYLTPGMRKLVARNKLGSYPDVYGRMWWDRPAPTIKRECGHVGNGRYAHPTEDRLCSLREMALLNGFPADFRFGATSLANKYRHIGDAVPPLISYQIAAAVAWTLTERRPDLADIVLPGTTLRPADIQHAAEAAA